MRYGGYGYSNYGYSNYGFFYDMKRGLSILFTFISIFGSLMVLHYLTKIEKEPDCVKISPKLLDFINKYNILILISSLASIVFVVTGFS